MARAFSALILLISLHFVGCSDEPWGTLEVNLRNLAAPLGAGDAIDVTLLQGQERSTLRFDRGHLGAGSRLRIEGVVARKTSLELEVLVAGEATQRGVAEDIDVVAGATTAVAVDLGQAPPPGCTTDTPPRAGDGCCPAGKTHQDDPDCCQPGTLRSNDLGVEGRDAAFAADAHGGIFVAYLDADRRLRWLAQPGKGGLLGAAVLGRPLVAITPAGAPVIVYLEREKRELHVAVGKGGPDYSWDDVVVDTLQSSTFQGSIAVTADGSVHLAYLSGAPPAQARYATNRGGTWSAVALAMKTTIAGDKLRLAAGPKTVHLCHVTVSAATLEHGTIHPTEGLKLQTLAHDETDLFDCQIAVDATENPHILVSPYQGIVSYGAQSKGSSRGRAGGEVKWSWRKLTTYTTARGARVVGGALHLAANRGTLGIWHGWASLSDLQWQELKLMNVVSLPFAFDVDASGMAHALSTAKPTAPGALTHHRHCTR